jgi:hypothetical protein
MSQKIPTSYHLATHTSIKKDAIRPSHNIYCKNREYKICPTWRNNVFQISRAAGRTFRILHKYLIRERLEQGKLASNPGTVPKWVGPPYPGLRSFTGDEASIFFGRPQGTQIISGLYRDAEERFLAVVGASGTGKSSLIRVGLIPRIRSGQIDGQGDWLCVTILPADSEGNPFLALGRQLVELNVTKDSAERIATQLYSWPGYITELLDLMAASTLAASRLCPLR